ncbi:hypothetical protein SBOR_2656 [Sclerotinia borealis F-4128]|uniref:Uncharacterized protein n=1 Tax=Sclerotinia borealis (strain F-4128) TaxID=1432307 RepID=W9CQU4_SCLBF|nr:hypothetical protein SBOR_2656 [Sclerotinia borealis F-4128]
MGNKNNRGSPQQAAIDDQLHQQQVQAQQHAMDFDYSNLPQHPALHVEKASGTVKLFIRIDIVHSHLTAKEVNFLTILPKYAPMIKVVEVLLIAPTHHESIEVYNLRVKNMIKTIKILNALDLNELHFVISLNRRDNFNQMELAAACFGLNFDHWTMSTTVFGNKKKGFKIGVHSPTARRLAGVYKRDFLTQNVL